jgi:hypothetical protein
LRVSATISCLFPRCLEGLAMLSLESLTASNSYFNLAGTQHSAHTCC